RMPSKVRGARDPRAGLSLGLPPTHRTHLTDFPPLGALLALNKPPGLPVLGEYRRPGDLSLDALLPALRQRLGLPAELHVVKAPAREYSGLVLLSSCYHTTKKLQQFFTDARCRGQYPATYRVKSLQEGIAQGVLRAVALQVVPVPAPGRRSLARKDVKSTLTRYRVLSAVGGCALLQLQPRTGPGRGVAVPAGAFSTAAPSPPTPHPPAGARAA
uniref:Pseudouridine synthase RsuA/RluA-like domain-containing protein n=1 Tax=Zonotrichia albicollis TaxID=44394 RepID=A0A8D2NH00_ZONAL